MVVLNSGAMHQDENMECSRIVNTFIITGVDEHMGYQVDGVLSIQITQ